MNPQMIEAMQWQAQALTLNMFSKAAQIFGQETDEIELRLTGFVFRPATEEDCKDKFKPDEDLNPDFLYVFEAHFLAETDLQIGNLMSRILLYFDTCDTYELATKRFVSEVSKLKANTPEDIN